MSAKDIVLAAAGGGQITTAIEYVGGKTVSITPSTTSNTTISLTDLTGSPSPSLQAGDIVIVSYTISVASSSRANVTSSGYTTLVSLQANDTIDTNLYIGYKIMGATPDTSVTVTPTSSTDISGCVAIQAYRNVDEVYPIQQPANKATFTGTVRPTPPTITPWDADSVAVIVGAGGHNRGNVSYTTTGLTNFISIGGTDTSQDASIGAGFRVIQSGSYSPNRFNFPQADNSTYSSAGASIALKPKPDTVVPTFISYRSGVTGGNSLTLTAPTGIQSGDLLLLFIVDATSGLPVFTAPSGFSLNTSITNNSYDIRSYIYKKTATSSEPASYTITATGTVGNFSAILAVFRNANTVNTVGAGNFVSSRSVSASSITPTRGGMLLSLFANQGGKTVVTPPTGVTLLGTAGGTPGTAMYYTTGGPYIPTELQQLQWSGASGTANQTVSYQLQITQE
jgi:hypothetical protein